MSAVEEFGFKKVMHAHSTTYSHSINGLKVKTESPTPDPQSPSPSRGDDYYQYLVKNVFLGRELSKNSYKIN